MRASRDQRRRRGTNGVGSDGCDIGAHERNGDSNADPALFADDFEAGHPLHWSLEAS